MLTFGKNTHMHNLHPFLLYRQSKYKVVANLRLEKSCLCLKLSWLKWEERGGSAIETFTRFMVILHHSGGKGGEKYWIMHQQDSICARACLWSWALSWCLPNDNCSIDSPPCYKLLIERCNITLTLLQYSRRHLPATQWSLTWFVIPTTISPNT